MSIDLTSVSSIGDGMLGGGMIGGGMPQTGGDGEVGSALKQHIEACMNQRHDVRNLSPHRAATRASCWLRTTNTRTDSMAAKPPLALQAAETLEAVAPSCSRAREEGGVVSGV